MIITIYELLGMVKDGKAPKKIKYNDTLYEYDSIDEFYFHNGSSLYREFFKNGNCLNNEVEILEEEKKILEKLKEVYISNESMSDLEIYLRHDENIIIHKINEIIDYLNSKGDE